MKLNSSSFILAAFLCACFAANTFAAGPWTGFKCGPVYDPDPMMQIFDYECSLGQFDSKEDAVEKGYSEANLYDVLGGDDGFQNKLNEGISNALSVCSSDGMCMGFSIVFETDIDYGGIKVVDGDTACVNDVAPVTIPVGVFTYTINVNGNEHTINGFCNIGRGSRSFFIGRGYYGTNTEKNGNLQNVYIDKLRFDGAYVKATLYEANAAVVAATAASANFYNITITNSKVISDGTAGGIVAVDSVASSANVVDMSFKVSNSHVDVELDAPQAVGGIIGRMTFQKGTGTFESNTVSVKFKKCGSCGAVGGLVGEVTRAGGTDNVAVTSNGDNVTLDFEALASNSDRLYVGGGFGMVQNAYSVTVENGTFDISISAAGDGNQYFGGLVGRARMEENGGVGGSGNQMKVSIASTNTGNIEVAMGGLVGYVTERNSTENNTTRGVKVVSNKDELTLSMEAASTGKIYAGGLVGYAVAEIGNSWPMGGLDALSTVVKAPEGGDLITISSKNVKELAVGGMGGKIVAPRGYVFLAKNSVEGDIDVAAESFADSGAVGGLVGYAFCIRPQIYKNAVLGNVISQTENVGYVAGKFGMNEIYSDSYVYTNIHYGMKDANIDRAVGAVVVDGNPLNNWDDGRLSYQGGNFNIVYNYRNSIETGTVTLAPNGKLDLNGDGYVSQDIPDGDGGTTRKRVQNGILSDSMMTSRLLTYVLNEMTKVFYDSSYTCWENEPGELPHICDESASQTAFKVEIELGNIQSDLTSEDFKTLECDLDTIQQDAVSLYSVITYTEKDGRLNEDFVKRLKSLSVDVGVVDQNAKALNLDHMLITANEGYYADENYVIRFVYEIYSEEAEDYVELDDPSLGTIYFFPKQDTASRYGSSAMVPTMIMTSDAYGEEHYVNELLVECNGVEGCSSETIPVSKGFMTYSDLVNYAAQNLDLVRNNAVLHLRYTSSATSVAPKLSTESGSKQVKVTAVRYGLKDAQLTVLDDMVLDGDPSSIFSGQMVHAFGFEVEAGFVPQNWTIDLWAYDSEALSSRDIEECYDSSTASEACSMVNSFDGSGNYFAGPKEMAMSLSDGVNSGKNVKWSVKIGPEEKIDMDSVATAVAWFYGNALPYRYHMHVVPEVSAVHYTISFDANAGGDPVFVGGNMDTLATYSRENDTTAALPVLYGTESCFWGWSARADTGSNYEMLTADLLGKVDIIDSSFNLYGSWFPEGDKRCADGGEDSIATKQVILKIEGGEGSDRGEIYLWQRLVNPGGNSQVFRHDFVGNKLEIPDANEVFRFHVGANAKPGYALDSLKLVWTDPEMGEEKEVIIDVEDPVILWDYSIGENPTLYAKFVEIINVDLVLNTSAEDLFYDLDFTQGDPLEVRNTGDQMELPTWIYTTDACVTGWSFYADVDTVDAHVMTFGDRLYKNLYENRTMYAVWRDAQICVDSNRYVPVTTESENGSVELVEYSYDGRERVHRFGADGSLILPPSSYAGEMFVQAVPARGYVLDSIVMVEGGESETIGNGTMISYGAEGFELRAYFSESGEPLGDDGPVLVQSGNAVRFSFPGGDFVRGSDAWVHILLENDAGDTTDSTFWCSRYGCDIQWNKFPLKGGDYQFTAQMFDGYDTTEFKRFFQVAKEIAVGKSWHMVSLANVDMDSFRWDGDEKVYLWNEQQNYGRYWQYQELTQKGSPEQERGYWYLSLEGKSLKLNEEAIVDEMEWNLDSLYSGWNLVANPYGWYAQLGVYRVDSAMVMQWYDEEKQNEDVDLEWLESEKEMMLAPPPVEFWSWDEKSGQYVQADTLKPYEAVWAKVNDAEYRQWRLGPHPVFVDTVKLVNEDRPQAQQARGLFKAVAKPSKGPSWALQAMLSDARGKKDSWNLLGAGMRAWNSEEPPAGMGDRVNLTILDGGKRLAKSVKAAGEGATYEWTVELSATSGRKGYLEFAGIDGLLDKGLHAFLTIDGKTQEIHAGEKIAVDLSTTTKTATVRVAPTAKKAVVSELRGLRAFWAGNALQVEFDAAGMAGAKARVDVFDTKGGIVASNSLRAVDGVNMLSLEIPRRGLYAVRVAVAGQVSVRKVLVR